MSVAVSIFKAAFEGKTVVFFHWRGRQACLVQSFGLMLEYARDGRKLVDMFTKNWAGEAVRGHHYDIIEGADLAELREVLGVDTNLVSSRAPSVAILYEPGFHLACIKTDKPVGVRCRAWLTDDVMPQIMRTGRYEPPALPSADHLAVLDPAAEARLIKVCTEAAAQAATKAALAVVEATRASGNQALTPCIGKALGDSVNAALRSAAKRMTPKDKPKAYRSILGELTLNLRTAMEFYGTNRGWADFPWARWPDLKAKLEELRRLSEKVGEDPQTDFFSRLIDAARSTN